MSFTQEDVIQYVESEDVKFIRLAFCDAQGSQKNLAIMPGALHRAFTQGIPVDMGPIPGFGPGPVLLRPDPATLLQMPWRPQHGRVVHMFCDLLTPEGAPHPQDARGQLKSLLQGANKGADIFVAAEMPFVLYKLDDKGRPTAEPHDEAGYLDIAPTDRGENVRRAICLTLEQMGIEPESSRHGAGPGENLIRYQGAGPLEAADDMVTFQAVVRTMADQNGLFAAFACPPRLFVKQGGQTREAPPCEGWQNPYRLMAALAQGQV